MKKLSLFFLAALFAASPILAQSISTSPLVVGPLPANFGTAYQNLPFSGNVTSNGVIGGVPPYTCSKVSGSFPTGISDVTAGCIVSGTPTGSTGATEVVKIADSGNSAVVLAIAINVQTLSAISVTSQAGSSVLNGNTLQLKCSSTWSDNSGIDLTSLATWASSNTGIFTINSSGLLSTVSGGSANGTCAFNSMTSPNFSVTVTTGSVTVSTASLPNCQQNLTYQPPSGFQLVASGGTPPYTWTQTGGTLPTGLSLSSAGVISGVCAGTTASSLVFKATDTLSSNGSTGSLTLTVATLSSIAVTPASPTISAGTQQQFVGTGTYSDGSTANLTNVGGGTSSNLTLVNKASTGSSGTTSVTTVASNGTGGTGAIATTSGNLLWVECHHGTDTTTTCTPSDTAGNTFTSIATVTSAAEGFLETFYAKNITGNASDVLTCTFNNPVQFASCGMHQISGASTSGPLDSSSVVSTSGSSGNSATTPSFSTAIANEMEDVAFGVASSGLSGTAGTGYTFQILQSGDTGTGSEDQTFSTIQSSVTASMSWTGSSLAWLIIGDAFEAAVTSLGCNWSSGTLSVATVNASGLVTSTTGNGGTSVIECAVGAVNGSTTLTVTPVGVTSLTIAPPSASPAIGTQVSFTCTDNNGNNVTSSATFGSNLPSVFLFGTPNGTGTAEAGGTALVTCSKSGVTSNQATVTVPGSGQVLNAASCNPADIQAQLTLATGPSTTINIPSGTCLWTTKIVFAAPTTMTGTLTLQGQTTCTGSGDPAFNNLVCTDGTIIQDNDANANDGVILFIGNDHGGLRYTGLTFQKGTGVTKNSGLIEGRSAALRIDHDAFYGDTGSGSSPLIGIAGCSRGVIDHSHLRNNSSTVANSIQYFNGINCGGTDGINGDNTWAQATGFGTSDFFFEEQNLIETNNESPASELVDDCTDGGKAVIRFNTFINGAHIQTHPTGGSGARGCRATEAYGNNSKASITFPNASPWFFFSSGPAMLWGNTFTTSQASWAAVVNFKDCRIQGAGCGYTQFAPPNGWSYCGASSAWDGNVGNGGANTDSPGYPCIDQTNRGQGDLLSGNFPTMCNSTLNPACTIFTGQYPRQKLEPMYYFLNLAPVSMTPVANGLGTLATANIDYYVSSDAQSGTDCTGFTGATGVGCGPRSSRPSTCTPSVGWWATGPTDSIAWNTSGNGFGNGELDVCTATNTWTNGQYVPYTYPHPLDH